MIIKTEIRSQETRRFIICQSKGQADILKAAELSIFKITMEGKAKKYEDRKDLTDYMEPVGEKESSYGSDGRKFFVGRRMCLRRPCRDRVLCGFGRGGRTGSRKIQAEGISVRILFPEETEEEFLADVCGEIQKGCECIKAKLTSLSAEGTAAVQTPIVYACAGGTKVQDPGMHALEETADKKTGNRQKFVKNRELLLCGYAGLEGSLRILEAAEEELSQRFINTFLMQAKKLRDQLITPEQILEAAKGRDISVWQIGSGGILAALWEMAEEEKIGFEIAMGSISLKQETVEICEYYRLNPYQLTSAGSYLILTDEADQVIEVLEKAGARAVRLGVAKAQNARVITSKEEIRYLDRPAPDELARWQKDYKKCEK